MTLRPEERPVSAGSGFDIPIEPNLRVGSPGGDAPLPAASPAGVEPGRLGSGPARGSTRSAGRGASVPSSPQASNAAPPGETVEVFGAAGERGSVDLATAFTRAFPQAASADPVWLTAPFGGAGEADVILDLDEDGHLEDARVTGDAPVALREGIDRTLALIRAREFTSAGPRTTLHVTASVSPDVVHDGLHGDVFAIGGSYLQGEGQAFFALAAGRRIDVRVRARR